MYEYSSRYNRPPVANQCCPWERLRDRECNPCRPDDAAYDHDPVLGLCRELRSIIIITFFIIITADTF